MGTPGGPVSTLAERLAALENIVRQLEDEPGLGLDEALDLYEKGRRLSAACRGELERARLRLTEIDAAIGSGELDA